MRPKETPARSLRRRPAIVLAAATAVVFGVAGTAAAAPAFDQYAPVAPGPGADRHSTDRRIDREHDALAYLLRERAARETGDRTLKPTGRPRARSNENQPPVAAAIRSSRGGDFGSATRESFFDNFFSSFGVAMAGLVVAATALIVRRMRRANGG